MLALQFQEAALDGLNFSARNMQQLINNALKDAKAITLITTNGDQLTVGAPIELGTECIAYKSHGNSGTSIVPFHAIQRIQIS